MSSNHPILRHEDDSHGDAALVSPEMYGLANSEGAQELSLLDMNMPRLYAIRWLLCFPLDSEASHDDIYEELRIGLARTIAKIPWIAGNIVEEAPGGNPNRIRIDHGSGAVKLIRSDLGDVLLPYAELRKRNFPLAELPSARLCPLGVIPQSPEPVMAAQANFVDGGLLLSIVFHHCACDGSGVSSILDEWAKNMNLGSEHDASKSHDAHARALGPLSQGKPGANADDFPEYLLRPTPPTAALDIASHQMAEMPYQLPPMTTRLFEFSPESLATLKNVAVAYSSNDALMALIWRHMTLARFPAEGDLDSTSKDTTTALLTAVDVRGRTNPPLPSRYLGNASMAALTTRVPVLTLLHGDGHTQGAAAIRASINDIGKTDRIASTIGLLASRPDPTDFKFAYNAFLGPDISTTSWAQLACYERQWGSLGFVDKFRIPGDGADGVVMVLPRLKDDNLEVAVGLEDTAMARLLKDTHFLSYARLSA